MEDKKSRRFERHELHWAVEIDAESWAEVASLTTSDVSRGGVFVVSASPPPVDTVIKLALALPDGSRLRLEGTVVHAEDEATARAHGRDAGFGLRFDERYAIDLNLLEAIVAAHVGRPGPQASPGLRLPDTLPGVGRLSTEDPLPAPGGPIAPWATGAVSGEEDEGASFEREPSSLGRALGRRAVEPVAKSAVSFRAPSGQAPQAPRGAGQAEADDVVLDVSVEAQEFAPDTVFGIDLGTTNTAIGAVVDGELRVFEDVEGTPFVPSVVSYDEGGRVLVGWEARELLTRQPMSTVASVKRLLGRRYKDPQLGPILARLPVPTVEGPDGQVVLKIHGEEVAVPQVVAEIFRHAARIVERAVGFAPTRIVVAGPIGWTNERAALRRAAELAGLTVAGWLDEPMAAALAYGARSERDELVAVYDFGGGTFDATVLQIRGGGGGYETLATGGDAWLGGDDFDEALTEHAAAEFWHQTKVDLHSRQVEWMRLRTACEGVKRRLSVQQSAELHVRGLALSIRGALDLRMTFTRGLIETLCEGLVDRSLAAMGACIAEAGTTPAEIQRVVMVGGVARMPVVRERLQRFFGRDLRFVLNPEQAVVGGAAIYGAVLREQALRKG